MNHLNKYEKYFEGIEYPWELCKVVHYKTIS